MVSSRGQQAQHRSVKEWMDNVEDGKLQLPEFQRDVVWNQRYVCDLLKAILQNRPVGCLLIVNLDTTDDSEHLRYRSIEGTDVPGEQPKELILDGQQRITALWRALTGNDKRHRYFIRYHHEYDSGTCEIRAFSTSLNWINSPSECFESNRRWIPINIFLKRPASDDALMDEISKWVDSTECEGTNSCFGLTKMKLQSWILQRSEEIRFFNLPFLPLPEGTTRLEAIDTFIKTNTSSQKLRRFDIIVGELLKEKSSQLRDYRERMLTNVHNLQDYFSESEVGDLVLKTACLVAGYIPTESNYGKSDVFSFLDDHMDEIEMGFTFSVTLLDNEKIFDKQRLPSVVPLRVLPALYCVLPDGKRSAPTIKKVLRGYLWRAFVTDRYSRSAASKLKEDFDALRKSIHGDIDPSSIVPVWRSDIPKISEIITEGWPKRVGTLKRALLAVSLRTGAKDIGTDEAVTRRNLRKREYHHVFPKAYMSKKAHSQEPDLAMNCMLVDAKSNREAASKPPLEYMSDLILHEHGAQITSKEIKKRLQTHIIPSEILDTYSVQHSVATGYRDFTINRAKLVLEHIKALVNGNEPD